LTNILGPQTESSVKDRRYDNPPGTRLKLAAGYGGEQFKCKLFLHKDLT